MTKLLNAQKNLQSNQCRRQEKKMGETAHTFLENYIDLYNLNARTFACARKLAVQQQKKYRLQEKKISIFDPITNNFCNRADYKEKIKIKISGFMKVTAGNTFDLQINGRDK